MPEFSVVIITFNEERNIARCLDSVKEITNDIVVVDSFSTDKTEELCRARNARFIQRPWEGYAATKNFANTQAKYDWILSLDADEALSEQLKKALVKLKREESFVCTSFNRLTNYCGTWIKHGGWYPDTKIRLFNRTKSYWKGMIHEELMVPKGEIVRHIKADILHYSYYSIEEHNKQSDHYTTIGAKALFNKGKKGGVIKLYLSPIAKFINSYFLRLGILDGYYGFMICKISARSTYLKYFKLKQLYKQASSA